MILKKILKNLGIKRVKIFLTRILIIIVILSTIIYVNNNLKSNNLDSDFDKIEEIEIKPIHKDKNKSEIEIDDINFIGKTKNNEKYVIFSKNAFKKDDGVYDLNEINAEIFYKSDILHLKSKKAFYHEGYNNIILDKNVRGDFLGYNLIGESIELNLDSKKSSSKDEVIIYDEENYIRSDGFKTKNEDEIVFEGNVESHYNFSS